MRCWQVTCQVALLLLACGAPAFRIYSQRRLQLPPVEMNCYEMPLKITAITPAKIKSEAWRTQKKVKLSTLTPTDTKTTSEPSLNAHEIQRRFDHLFTEGDDIVKEHAKLVQDINSLRQVVFVAPLFDEVRDYDDSVYHEVIETSTSTTPRPTTTKTTRPRAKPSSIPVLLAGGASQRQPVRSPQRAPRPTVSLVGTSVVPLVRHPYPFVGQASSQKPYKVCMPTMPMYTTTSRPSLWNRLLSFFPRLTG